MKSTDSSEEKKGVEGGVSIKWLFGTVQFEERENDSRFDCDSRNDGGFVSVHDQVYTPKGSGV